MWLAVHDRGFKSGYINVVAHAEPEKAGGKVTQISQHTKRRPQGDNDASK